jgi:hypothetical protein
VVKKKSSNSNSNNNNNNQPTNHSKMAPIIKVILCPVNDAKLKLNLTDIATSHHPEWRVLPEGSTET